MKLEVGCKWFYDPSWVHWWKSHLSTMNMKESMAGYQITWNRKLALSDSMTLLSALVRSNSRPCGPLPAGACLQPRAAVCSPLKGKGFQPHHCADKLPNNKWNWANPIQDKEHCLHGEPLDNTFKHLQSEYKSNFQVSPALFSFFLNLACCDVSYCVSVCVSLNMPRVLFTGLPLFSV